MDGPSYDFCLPPEYAAYSLLPEVREHALALFAELGVPWHAGIGGGPSNHLLSSQVQCVNALGQMVADPDRIVRAFGPILGTAEVDQIEPGRWLTFEYIGSEDHLRRSAWAACGFAAPRARVSTRRSCTRTLTGVRELILVEWKYTERYGPSHGGRRQGRRAARAIRAICSPRRTGRSSPAWCRSRSCFRSRSTS